MRNVRDWLRPLVYLSNNFISLLGVVIVTTATIFWLYFLQITIRGVVPNAYTGIAVYMVIPAFFILGLLLIPIGIWWTRRSKTAKGELPSEFPPLDPANSELRKLVGFIGVTTVLNLIIAAQFSYSAINYMDSVTFCGQTCHTVMQPEFTAHRRSPHSRVECVSCHIGPGAGWFVRSKLSGTGQVIAVLLNNYPRPIPVPVHNLRPARETCETCHWPQKFDEDRLRDIVSYASDEQNTETHNVLLMHLGGGPSRVGIHGRHVGPGIQVRYYASDEKRQNIPWVEYTSGGQTTVYAAAGATRPPESRLRVMDCIDCHNRPTHIFQLPERAMDEELALGEVSPTLPFARKTGLSLIKADYRTRKEAAEKIPAAFEQFYKTSYPQIYSERHNEITRAAQGVLAAYLNNVFPQMNVTWGTYPNNLGHTDFIGCFRCHDEAHTAKNGKTITQDCSACHNLLASDEKTPRILVDLGLENAPAETPKTTEPKKK